MTACSAYLDDVLDAEERMLRIEAVANPHTQTPEQVVLRREQLAELYVPETEFEAWCAMSNVGAKAAIDALGAYSGRLHRFGYQDTLPLGITALAVPGHTPGHTVYRVGRLLIAGDLMHGFDLQIKDLTICPDYDMDRSRAVESRRKYIDYVRQNKLVTAGMHFPGNGVKDSL